MPIVSRRIFNSKKPEAFKSATQGGGAAFPANTIRPNFFIDGDTLFGMTVAAQSALTINLPLLTDADTLFQPTVSGIPTPDFTWNAEEAETPPAAVSFTRATTAQVLTTTDNVTNWFQTAKSGEVRYEGLRREENHLSRDLTSWTSNVAGSGTSATVTASFADGVEGASNTATRVQMSPGGTGSGDIVTLQTTEAPANAFEFSTNSFWAKLNTGTSQDIILRDRNDNEKTITITDDWQRFGYVGAAVPSGSSRLQFRARGDVTGTSIDFLVDEGAGFPIVMFSTAENDIPPGGAVHRSTTYNAEVAGVRYFNTTNGNSVNGSFVVTEAAGTTITGGGFLSEPAVTNQFTTVDVSDAAWVKTNLTVTDNGINDLGLTEYELDAGTSTGDHNAFENVSSGTGAGCMYAIAKAGTGDFLIVRRGGGTTDDYACFNVSTGAITEEGAGIDDAFIIDLGNGWYLCVVITSDTSGNCHLAISDSGTPGTSIPSFTGANETILVCHVQYETNDFPTSPIITSGSTVTRNADRLSLTAATVGSDSAPFSIFADQTTPAVQAAALGSDDNAIVGLNGNDRLAVATGAMGATGSGLGATVSSTFGPSLRHKIAARFDTNDVAVAIEDETTATDSSYTVSTGDLDVGHAGTGREHRGLIHKFDVYDAALANGQLETLA